MTGSDPSAHGRRSQPSLLLPQAQLTTTARELAAAYAGVFSLQTVERYVFESDTALRRTATVDLHLTALAHRFAAGRLRALAQAEGVVAKEVPEVLFLASSRGSAFRVDRAADPHGQSTEVVRRIRDDIDRRGQSLLTELTAPDPTVKAPTEQKSHRG